MRSSRKKRLSLLEGLFFVLLLMIWESFWMCYMSICKKKTGYFQFFFIKNISNVSIRDYWNC